jgi:hypothetical protein
MPPEGVVFLSVVTLVGGFALLLPVVRALAERIRPQQESAIREELQVLREDLAQELQHMRREVAELSERLDFTDRLLAQQRDVPRIGTGQ